MTNFLLVYGFRKMFFIGQILKRVYVKLSFDQLLILFCLQIFFCLKFDFPFHQRNKQKYITIHILMLTNQFVSGKELDTFL